MSGNKKSIYSKFPKYRLSDDDEPSTPDQAANASTVASSENVGCALEICPFCEKLMNKEDLTNHNERCDNLNEIRLSAPGWRNRRDASLERFRRRRQQCGSSRIAGSGHIQDECTSDVQYEQQTANEAQAEEELGNRAKQTPPQDGDGN